VSARMPHHNFDSIQRWLCQEAIALIGFPGIPANAAYKAMAFEPDMLLHWWDGAFEQNEQETVLLDLAARAFAHGQPLPELSLAQRGRLALRLRLASRILRALRSSPTKSPKGWFQAKLHKFSEPDLLEWLLVDAWPMCAEILDESLSWEDEFEHPPGKSMRRPPQKISSEDSASFSA
jgi:hypothetical protein